MDAATVGTMGGAFGSLVLVGGSATVATAWIRQKLLNLCALVQVSRSLSLEEMREFDRPLFSPVSFPCHGV
jgi:hypothetical protein